MQFKPVYFSHYYVFLVSIHASWQVKDKIFNLLITKPFQKFLNVWESRVDGILLGTMEYLGRSGGHA